MESKRRPILNGYYSFERLRKGNDIYMDKTAYLHRLITKFELALQAMTEQSTSLAVLIDEYDAPIGHALHNLMWGGAFVERSRV